MIWAVLAAVGVPLWLCAIAISTLLYRNRALRRRPGNVPVRVRRSGKRRWSPGHAFWAHDVFAFRGSPAAWQEHIDWVVAASTRRPTADERRKLRRIGGDPVVATFTVHEGESFEVAARREHEDALLGPHAATEALERRPAIPT
jgi:hypothetical protein